MARSYAELMGLEYEAERLVRSGESRAEVSRRLGVHLSTLSQWALRGGWRKKDLDLERSAAATRATILAIRHGNAQAGRQNELRLRLSETLREAVELLGEGSEASLARLSGLIGGVEDYKRLETPKVALPPDRLVAKTRSLGEADENETSVIHDENGVPWTPERQREALRLAREGNGR